MIHLKMMNLEKIKRIDHYGLLESLANDAKVKQYISRDFLNWLTKYQTDTDEVIEPLKAYVICLENRYVGVVGSLSFSDEGTLELWYAIKKNLRGRGYGNQILEEITPHLFEQLKDVEAIELKMDPSNIASQKVARYNGYVKDGYDEDLDLEVYHYSRKQR